MFRGLARITTITILLALSVSRALSDVPQRFIGQVTEVASDGSFSVLHNGAVASTWYQFWGLEIIDAVSLRHVLVGRIVDCSIVLNETALPSVYCLAYPNIHDIVVASPPIPLLLWLADFGYAQPICTQLERSTFVSDGGTKSWFCGANLRPHYRPTRFE